MSNEPMPATDPDEAGIEPEKTPMQLKKEKAAAEQKQHETVLEMQRIVRLAKKVTQLKHELHTATDALDKTNRDIVLKAEDGVVAKAW